MEQISKAYGRFLLEGLVVVLLLVLMFTGVKDSEGNFGIFRMLGARIDEEEIAISKEDIAGYQEEGTKMPPVITYVDTGSVHVGEYAVGAMFKALDYSGMSLDIEVCSILDPSGTERLEEYNADASRICFTVPGIYVVEVAANDAWNRRSICRVRIPVNS